MVKLEVFRGQIRINEKRTYFGLDYELTDEVGNLVDEYKKLDCENQQLKEQLQQKEDIINEITNYCKFQIEKEQDKFPKPIESEEWLKGRISSFEEILDNKGE